MQITKALSTVKISPKAVLAFFYPLGATVVAAVVSWISTGAFNAQEIRISVGGLILSGFASLGAYIGVPGVVRVPSASGTGKPPAPPTP